MYILYSWCEYNQYTYITLPCCLCFNLLIIQMHHLTKFLEFLILSSSYNFNKNLINVFFRWFKQTLINIIKKSCYYKFWFSSDMQWHALFIIYEYYSNSIFIFLSYQFAIHYFYCTLTHLKRSWRGEEGVVGRESLSNISPSFQYWCPT